MSHSLSTLCEIIKIFDEIINGSEASASFIARFERSDTKSSVSLDTITIIKNLSKLLLLDKKISLPYALIMKFFLEIVKEGKKITDSYCKKFFTIYAYSILFSLFALKKEIPTIEPILQAKDWHKVLKAKLDGFFKQGGITDRRAVFQCKYLVDDTGVTEHKCKALAILYNFFLLDNETIKIKKGKNKELCTYLIDSNKFSVEHFIVNNGKKVCFKQFDEEIEYPKEINKYANSLFNYIFIPENLNNNILQNFYITDKILLLKSCENEVTCSYSKMVINCVEKYFVNSMPKGNGKIGDKSMEEYFGYQFKKEFINIANEIIANVIRELTAAQNGE